MVMRGFSGLLVTAAVLTADAGDGSLMVFRDAGLRERQREVAAMLAPEPASLGRVIGDRKAWRKAADGSADRILEIAERLLASPLPESPDGLYLEFSKTGNRTTWQDVAHQRRGRLRWLLLAECVENRGRFLPALEALIRALCDEPTWVMPAHDGSLANFRGRTVDIDLASADVGWQLATACHLLGAGLSAEVRALIRDRVAVRVLAPFRAMAAGRRRANWWLDTTNNWNAVCLAGVVGSALALEREAADRAFFITAAETLSRNFLRGFPRDGYCTEGLGYWNYGFGHYVMLSEMIVQATGGRVDLLARPEARLPALFASRIEIANGVSPAFADCKVKTRPGRGLMHYLSRRFWIDDPRWRGCPGLASLPLPEGLILRFPNSLDGAAPFRVTGAGMGGGLRDWFDASGILICRPHGASGRLAAAMKGGDNAEHHNHNDVGSFVVVVGKEPLLCDPGPEIYTARTFSPRRYESNLINSFGHPVPRVAARLQREGKAARGEVLRTSFTTAADRLVLDLRSAYPVPELAALERSFVYGREGSGSLTVSDRMEALLPVAFETALITFDRWRRTDEGLLISGRRDGAAVRIDCGGAAYAIDAVTIDEETRMPSKPVRLAIRLLEPTRAARVTLTITPARPVAEGQVP